MTITVELSIDLRNQGFPQRIRATQADANTRVVEVSLYDGGVAWPVPDGVAAAVGYRKPDGTAGLYDKLPDQLPLRRQQTRTAPHVLPGVDHGTSQG